MRLRGNSFRLKSANKLAGNKVAIICAASLAGKLVILEPEPRVLLPSVPRDVGWGSIPLRESHVVDSQGEHPRPWSIGVGAPILCTIVAPSMVWMGAAAALALLLLLPTPIGVH